MLHWPLYFLEPTDPSSFKFYVKAKVAVLQLAESQCGENETLDAVSPKVESRSEQCVSQRISADKAVG